MVGYSMVWCGKGREGKGKEGKVWRGGGGGGWWFSVLINLGSTRALLSAL